MVIVNQYNLELEQLGVKTTFLHIDLEVLPRFNYGQHSTMVASKIK